MDYSKLSREEQNRVLRQHGYHWEKITQDWLDDNDDFETVPGWHLYSKDHGEVSVERAFREIEIGVDAVVAEIRAAEEQELREQTVKRELARIRRQAEEWIREHGTRPENEQPEGRRVLDTQTIYGGGDWFVLGADCLWYIENNGMDGDNWSYNNVRTGGAGAIGWKAPMDDQVRETLVSLENGTLKEQLLASAPTPVRGYLVRSKLVDMDGEHVEEIGRAETWEAVEQLVENHFHGLQYEGVDSVDIEIRDNLEILYDGQLVGKCSRHWTVEWLNK